MQLPQPTTQQYHQSNRHTTPTRRIMNVHLSSHYHHLPRRYIQETTFYISFEWNGNVAVHTTKYYLHYMPTTGQCRSHAQWEHAGRDGAEVWSHSQSTRRRRGVTVKSRVCKYHIKRRRTNFNFSAYMASIHIAFVVKHHIQGHCCSAAGAIIWGTT